MKRKLTQGERLGLGMVAGDGVLLQLAARVTEIAEAPVVGGLAVALHGWVRATCGIDLYASDLKATHQRLLDAGIAWDAKRREHLIEGVPIHLVGDEALAGPPGRISRINGIRVVSLADLIRGKLTIGLENINRSKDVTDVIELIRCIPLKKDFAAKLPTRLRATFKMLVEQVHGPRRTTVPTLRLWSLA